MKRPHVIGLVVLVLVLITGAVLMSVFLTKDSDGSSGRDSSRSRGRGRSCVLSRCRSTGELTTGQLREQQGSVQCQCHLPCNAGNTCCPDPLTQCQQTSSVNLTESCVDRCGAPLNQSYSCQCNSACVGLDDCCSDYTALCLNSSQNNGSRCGDLAKISQNLWTSDLLRLPLDAAQINLQGQVPGKGVYEDNSTGPLYTYVDEAQLNSSVYTSFLALLDNYEPGKNLEEIVTAEETAEEEQFLDAILATPTMNILYDFLICEGKIQNASDFRVVLRRLWFDLYPRSSRSSILDSSGFEHVMVGEYKTAGSVNGMHSWLAFYQREKIGELDYYGYVCAHQNHTVCAVYKWAGRTKRYSTFFLRSSPAYDIAIYSLCSVMLPGKCSVLVDGEDMVIRTYIKKGHIESAYVQG